MSDRRAPPSSEASPPGPAAKERALKRVLSIVLVAALLIYFGVALIALTLRYAVFPHIDQFRPRLEAIASRALKTPVTIGHLSARWASLSPEIGLSDLRINGSDAQTALHVDHANAVIAWRSLFRLQPVLSSLVIDGADLYASRDNDGKLHIAGITLGQHGGNPYAFSNWLLAQQTVIARHTTLHWQDQQRGTPSLSTRDLRLALINRGEHHQLGLQTGFDDTALGALDVRVDFHHSLASTLLGRVVHDPALQRGNPRNWTGTAYISMPSMALPALGRYVPLPLAANDGTMGIDSWTHFAKGRLTRTEGKLSGTQLSLQIRDTLPPLVMPRVKARFTADIGTPVGASTPGLGGAEEYAVSFRDVSLALADVSTLNDGTPLDRLLDSARFDAHYWRPALGRGERIALSGDVLDLGLLADLTHALPLPQRIKHNLDRYEPHGVLTDYRLNWERQAPDSHAAVDAARTVGNLPLTRYQVHANLRGVSITGQPEAPGVNAAGHPHIGQPGFRNVDATIDADQSGGHLKLDSTNAGLTVRGLFEEPDFAFATLKGDVDWHITASGANPKIDAKLSSLQFANADAAGSMQARFQADLHHPQLGHLDLVGQMTRANVPSVPRYLPTSISPKVRHYLAHMFLAGDSHDVQFDIHGRLPDLPFPHGPDEPDAPHEASTFRISAPFNHGRLDVSPFPAIMLSNGQAEHWPAFEGVSGRFFTDGKLLGFDVSAAQYRGLRLATLTGRIDDQSDKSQDLMIRGKIHGPLDDMLHYVSASPLAYWSGGAAKDTQAQGDATLELQLAIPRNQAAQGNVVPATAGLTDAAPRPTDRSDAKAQVGQARLASVRASKIGVTGALSFDHNRVIKGQEPPIENLFGTIRFTERTADAQGLRARLLGGPLTASGSLRVDGSIDATLDGEAHPQVALSSDAAMNGVSPAEIAMIRRFSGAANYRLKLQREGHGTTTATLTSTLDGIGIDLPAPFGKRPGTPLPVSLTWRSFPAVVDTTASADDADNDDAANTTGATSDEHQARIQRRARLNQAALDGPRNLLPALMSLTRVPGTTSKPPLQRLEASVGPLRAIYLRRGGAQPEVLAGAIGINRPAVLPRHGVTATIQLDQFDADAWRNVIASLNVQRAQAQAASNKARVRALTIAALPAPLETPTTPATPASPPTLSFTAPDAHQTVLQSTAAQTSFHPVFHGIAPPSSPRANSWMPQHVAASIGDLVVLSRHWKNVELAIDQGQAAKDGMNQDGINTSEWQARIRAKDVDGTASWTPQNGGALRARFSQLTVPSVDPARQHADTAGASNLRTTGMQTAQHYPSFDLRVDNLVIGERHFGQLDLRARNGKNNGQPVWTLEQFSLKSAAAEFDATGDWRTIATPMDPMSTTLPAPNSQWLSTLDFKLAVFDGGALLDGLGLKNILKNGHGAMSGSLRWEGSPGNIDTRTLTGAVVMHMTKGQILKVNPGAARLIGLVSLQGLAQILQLDFHGLFGKGLAFNSLDGTGLITNGVVSTHDLALHTTPARVFLNGETSIPEQAQNLRVTIIPNINAGTASVATAVLNPVLGLGTLVAQMALAEPLSRSLTRRYDVSGSWKTPLVTRVDTNGNALSAPKPITTAIHAPAASAEPEHAASDTAALDAQKEVR